MVMAVMADPRLDLAGFFKWSTTHTRSKSPAVRQQPDQPTESLNDPHAAKPQHLDKSMLYPTLS
jgi:hypothetical protein